MVDQKEPISERGTALEVKEKTLCSLVEQELHAEMQSPYVILTLHALRNTQMGRKSAN